MPVLDGINAHLKATAEERRAQVADMFLEGQTYAQIAAHFGVSATTIRKDVVKARERWREEADLDFQTHFNAEMARIRKIEREAWVQFRKSQAEASEKMSLTEPAQPGPGGESGQPAAKPGSRKVEKSKREKSGAVAYMRIILDCLKERCKLLGLYAPEKLKIGGDGSPIDIDATAANFDKLPPAMQSMFIQLLEALTNGPNNGAPAIEAQPMAEPGSLGSPVARA